MPHVRGALHCLLLLFPLLLLGAGNGAGRPGSGLVPAVHILAADDAMYRLAADGGYERSELWLSDGWAAVRSGELIAPLYWCDRDGTHSTFTLGGRRQVNPNEPACHLSYYEADAIAHWMGARLPTEAEWEVAAASRPVTGNLLDLDVLHPLPSTTPPAPGVGQIYGDVWEWTASAYLPYPGFRPAAGAVGEYNGKFMSGQHVLRGGSCVTPPGHVRATYRNFFPPRARWVFSGARLARDVET